MSLDNQHFTPVTLTPLDKIKERLTKAEVWVWEHKKWIILAVATTAGVVLVVKKRSAIKNLLQSFAKDKLIADPVVMEQNGSTRPMG